MKKAKHCEAGSRLDERIEELMKDRSSQCVQQTPLRAFADSNYKTVYNECGKPRDKLGIWSDPVRAVERCFPESFQRPQWERALAVTQGTTPLEHAGAACAHLWTAGWMFDLVQQVRIWLPPS